MRRLRQNLILCAALTIPLQQSRGWIALSFRKIPANVVTRSPKGMHIEVHQSAGPLIYRLPQPTIVTGFKAELSTQGQLKDSRRANQVWEEDSVFRLGLVASGMSTLNFAQRLFAAEWVKTLFDLAPKGAGIDRIYFYDVAQRPQSLGISRIHPISEYIHEEVIAVQRGPAIKLEHHLNAPLEVLALWLSIDGDDSKSDFNVLIQQLDLQTQAP